MFFFNATATTEIYTLSLHDALPISLPVLSRIAGAQATSLAPSANLADDLKLDSLGRVELLSALEDQYQIELEDRKSTRLNSSHSQISYAVFCLKKKKKKIT